MSDAAAKPSVPPAAKPWWTSRTIWANAIAFAATEAAKRYGFVVSAEDQVAILGAVNVVLRAITKQPVSWSANP